MTGPVPGAGGGELRRALRPRSLLPLIVLLAVAGCDGGDEAAASLTTGRFKDVFHVVSRTELEDPARNVMGDIGVFLELGNGELVVSDALRPHVRRYGASGTLLGSAGRYGEGPDEFRRVGGLAEHAGSGVVVVDPRLGRLTLLTSEFTADTTLTLGRRFRGTVARMGEHLVFETASRDRASDITLFDTERWVPIWSVPAPSPGSIFEYPYWGSVASTPFAASADELVVAYSLLYPIYIHGRDGALRDSITTAPSSFRQARILESGQFSGPGGSRRLDDWLASFDIISRLAVVDDTLLVVVHGTLAGTPGIRFGARDERLDVYHLPSRGKLAEDIPLPPDTRVLGGGRVLHVLVAQPPEPWAIAAVRPRRELGRRR